MYRDARYCMIQVTTPEQMYKVYKTTKNHNAYCSQAYISERKSCQQRQKVTTD